MPIASMPALLRTRLWTSTWSIWAVLARKLRLRAVSSSVAPNGKRLNATLEEKQTLRCGSICFAVACTKSTIWKNHTTRLPNAKPNNTTYEDRMNSTNNRDHGDSGDSREKSAQNQDEIPNDSRAAQNYSVGRLKVWKLCFWDGKDMRHCCAKRLDAFKSRDAVGFDGFCSITTLGPEIWCGGRHPGPDSKP